MSTFFNNQTGVALLAALFVGILVGAKLILFLAKIFRGIIGPSYPPGGYPNQQLYHDPYHQSNQHQYRNGGGQIVGTILLIFVFGLMFFMAKSFWNNLGAEKKAAPESSGIGLTSNKNAPQKKAAPAHPSSESEAPPQPDYIPDFVTVQDLPAIEEKD